jgi:trans-aconitate methyltransferase
MRQQGRDGLAAWIRTTWLPYTEKVPVGRRDEFVSEAVDRYLAMHPLDAEGRATVPMVRLEVDAAKFPSPTR